MRISDNKRYIVDDNGKPFFYMADTAWRLFYCADREMADLYLRRRRDQGFTVFMPVILSEVFGTESEVNPYGHYALIDWDPTRPDEAFFEHVDWIIHRAASLGLVAGILPCWGEFVCDLLYGRGPQCFTPESAYTYGRFLGERYRNDPNIIWILGGDRNPSTPEHIELWRCMARGLRDGDGGCHCITYHPAPRDDIQTYSSADWMPEEEWIDFNMLQTGTVIDRPNYLWIRRDRQRTGIQKKPVLDGECRYEHSHEFFYTKPPTGRRINAHQVRKAMYNAMLSGAAGHTYGCRCVWNFYHEGEPKTRDTDLDWRKALDLEGAWQMQHMRTLLFDKYPFYELEPDFDERIIAYGQGKDGTYIPAAVSADRRCFLAYMPESMAFGINLDVLRGPARLRWYDVRTGEFLPAAEELHTGIQHILPPEIPGAPDFVLIAETVD